MTKVVNGLSWTFEINTSACTFFLQVIKLYIFWHTQSFSKSGPLNDCGLWTSSKYREPSSFQLFPDVWLPSHWVQSFSITPSVKLHPKCFFGCRFKNIICEEKGWRLNNYKTNKGNDSRRFCYIPLFTREGEDFAIFGAHQPQITSSALFNISVNTSSSAPRPLYSRNTTHRKTISRDRGILDDFLIGFIPLSCH